MAEAVKVTDEYDSAGRRLTAVDALIDETVQGDAGLATLFGRANGYRYEAWEAIARDLARQMINAETEIAELDGCIERWEDDVSDPDMAARIREFASRLQEEEQAHCDTYVEAVRLSAELAGWQDSAGAEYRKATAAARLSNYDDGSIASHITP